MVVSVPRQRRVRYVKTISARATEGTAAKCSGCGDPFTVEKAEWICRSCRRSIETDPDLWLELLLARHERHEP